MGNQTGSTGNQNPGNQGINKTGQVQQGYDKTGQGQKPGQSDFDKNNANKPGGMPDSPAKTSGPDDQGKQQR